MNMYYDILSPEKCNSCLALGYILTPNSFYISNFPERCMLEYSADCSYIVLVCIWSTCAFIQFDCCKFECKVFSLCCVNRLEVSLGKYWKANIEPEHRQKTEVEIRKFKVGLCKRYRKVIREKNVNINLTWHHSEESNPCIWFQMNSVMSQWNCML